MAERVDLQHQADLDLLALAQLDQPVEERLPVAVAGEVVVGEDEAVMPFATFARTICSISSAVR